MTTDVSKLAREIAKEMQRGSVFVSAASIARMCDYAPDSTPVRQMLLDPTFPVPTSIVEGGHKRWKRTEVESWLAAKAEATCKQIFEVARM